MKQKPDTGQIAQIVDQEGLHIIAHQRHDDEKAPHAVNNRWHGSEQFNSRAERRTQPVRRKLGQEESASESEGDGDEQCDDGRDQRAIDRHKRPIIFLHRVPIGFKDEAKTEMPERRQATDEERDDNRAQQHQHKQSGRTGEHRKYAIADG